MIERIEYLWDFGPYRNFVGNEASGIPAFKKFNLFYGWNYSGKTTLSHVFQSIEQKKLSRECAAASFKIIQNDGSEIISSDFSISPPVRVFNRDYVNQNFQQEHSAPAVFIIGEDNAKLKARQIQLQARLFRVEKIAYKLGDKRSEVDGEISKSGTTTARNIRDQIGDARFERPQLQQRIAEVRHNTAAYILKDEIVQARLATLHSQESFNELSMINPVLIDWTRLVREVNALLGQTASNRAIEQLKHDMNLEGWVRQGLSFHQGVDICKFCGSHLTGDRLDLLRGHFSQAYETLLRELEQKIEQVNNVNLNVSLPHDRDLIPDLRQEFIQLNSNLDNWLVWAGQIREDLITTIKQKRNAVETQSAWNGDLTRATESAAILVALNTVFESHNVLARSMGQTKSDAKIALERHYAAVYFEENELEKREQELVVIIKRILDSGTIKGRIVQAIGLINDQISRSAIGAAKLNELLKYLLAGSNIEVESVDESKFQFKRGGEIATNLSDGEKTAVTFAYFLTSLESNGTRLKDVIVFVDDPISSLDSNHIYAVYALILERLKDCHQLFVSTHNSEFFNLLKGEWLGKKGRSKPNSSAYYVSRKVQTDGSCHSEIADLPRLLRKYKSEYEYAFSHLHAFSQAASPSEHEAYTAPNLLRKLLESYLGFRKPNITAWHEKLDLLFDSAEQQREVHKFADDASHMQSHSRSLQQPAFVASAQRLVGDVIEALKNKDPVHHASLLEVVNGDNQ